MVWGQDSSVEEHLTKKPGAVLTRVWVPRRSKGFFSLSQLPVQTLLRHPDSPHFQSHASTSGRRLKIPIIGSHNIVWAHEDKILHTLLRVRVGSAALPLLCLTQVRHSKFPTRDKEVLTNKQDNKVCNPGRFSIASLGKGEWHFFTPM